MEFSSFGPSVSKNKQKNENPEYETRSISLISFIDRLTRDSVYRTLDACDASWSFQRIFRRKIGFGYFTGLIHIKTVIHLHVSK